MRHTLHFSKKVDFRLGIHSQNFFRPENVMLYKNFETQEALDRQYNPRFQTPNAQEVVDGYRVASQKICQTQEHQLNLPYGPTVAEHFDFFPAKTKGAPLHVFFHGGYWRSFSSKEFLFVAGPFLQAEVHVALVNYALCPAVSLDEIVRQCRASLAFLYRNPLELPYDSNQISISGHSAGGHLVGMMLATQWQKIYGLPQNLIKSACALSGLFDLSPFPYTWLQPQLQLTWEQVAKNSPIHHLPTSSTPTLVAVGSEESEEFHAQSEMYVQALQNNEHAVAHLDLASRNHFTILHEFLGQGGNLFQKILETLRQAVATPKHTADF